MFDFVKPVKDICIAFPLIQISRISYLCIYSFKYLFADFSDFRFCRGNYSTSKVIVEFSL